MKPLDLQQTPEEFRLFATALLRQSNAESALIRLLGTIGPMVPPSSAAAFARQLRSSLSESEPMRRITDYFVDLERKVVLDGQLRGRADQRPELRPLRMIDPDDASLEGAGLSELRMSGEAENSLPAVEVGEADGDPRDLRRFISRSALR